MFMFPAAEPQDASSQVGLEGVSRCGYQQMRPQTRGRLPLPQNPQAGDTSHSLAPRSHSSASAKSAGTPRTPLHRGAPAPSGPAPLPPPPSPTLAAGRRQTRKRACAVDLPRSALRIAPRPGVFLSLPQHSRPGNTRPTPENNPARAHTPIRAHARTAFAQRRPRGVSVVARRGEA
jgi:hypothetical protein